MLGTVLSTGDTTMTQIDMIAVFIDKETSR